MRTLLRYISIFFLYISYAHSHNQNEITIYVHGTKIPGIDIILELTSGIIPHGLYCANELIHLYNPHTIIAALCDNKYGISTLDNLYFFGWDGIFPQHREKEAYFLYDEIIDLIQFKKRYQAQNKPFFIRIVTHSHGGNIVLYLARILREHNMPFIIDELVMMGCPIQKITQDYIKLPSIKKVIHIYSRKDGIQQNDFQGLYSDSFKDSEKTPLRSQRNFAIHLDKLWQFQIMIDQKSYGHQTFTKPHFLKHVPLIVQATTRHSAGEYMLNIVTNKKAPLELINVIAHA